ncbi:MAG: hypothetical protein WAL11_01950, partial [Pseudolabrys sp.]
RLLEDFVSLPGGSQQTTSVAPTGILTYPLLRFYSQTPYGCQLGVSASVVLRDSYANRAASLVISLTGRSVRLPPATGKLLAIALNSGSLALVPVRSAEQLHSRQEELT